MRRRNDHNPKRPENMSRPELVYELSRHARPEHYRAIIAWPTPILRNVLAFYRTPEATTTDFKMTIGGKMLKKLTLNMNFSNGSLDSLLKVDSIPDEVWVDMIMKI